jgi:tRNA(Ile)-lysidine synthase
MRSTEGLRVSAGRAIEQIGPGLYGCACSGGADSIALADAVIACARAANVVIVIIDHGLRTGSADVADQVAAWARGQGAAAVVRRVAVEPRASIEAAARDARYAALAEIADELGLAAILLGHTARDQAETVLMRVLRGTGPAGLAGIPRRRGLFVRPFLELPRAAIDAYIAEHHLPTWHDPMNDDARITRVRVRERVLPVLRAENPALDDALLRLAASAREWTEVIDAAARPFARFPIVCSELARQPAAIRKRAVALALEAANLAYDATHLDALDAIVTAPPRGEVAIDLPGARLVRTYDDLSPVSGRSPKSEVRSPPPGHDLRTWQPGDRMRPARLQGRSRKLSDLYIDAKVPRAARRTARVLVRQSDRTIVWAEFIGLAFGESPEVLPA